MVVQVRIIFVLAMLHNFIHKHGVNETDYDTESDSDDDPTPDNTLDEPEDMSETNGGLTAGEELRDSIAEAMWEDYLLIAANRRRQYLFE